MFKAFGNFLHRTPWWAMILIGLLSLIMLGIFTLPAQVIRLSSSGETPEMNRAIKREIDSAFGDSALGLAEGVVAAMRERTTDPARRRELDQAQEGIAEARREIFNAQDEIKRAVKDAAQGAAVDAAQAARDAAKDSAATAIDGALTAAEAMLESASERREAIEEARADVEKSLKSAGVVAPDALKSLDEQLRAVKTQEEAAKKAVEALTKSKVEAGKANLDLNFDINGTKFKISGGEGAKEELKAAIKAGVEKGIKEATKGAPRVSNSAPKPPAPAGSASPAPPAPLSPLSSLSPLATPVAPAAPALPALPADLRQDIHAKVAQDVKRIGLGSALILTFIPLFFMTLIAKFLIDRSRRAQAFGESQKKVAEVQSAGRQLMEARLQALQAQVEPHFLYNTLANVQALTEVDPPAANKMVGHLIEYLRAALPKMRETSSTIGQEVELARAYLNILKMRMGVRLDFAIQVPDELNGVPFPPLMLPSLVENAVKHGLEPVREGGRIDVIAEKVGERFRIIVKDTGRGLAANGTTSANAETGGGVGLANIRERLLALYGETAKLSLESNEPKGVIATIEIPAEAMMRFSATGAAPSMKPGVNTTDNKAKPRGWTGRTLSAVGTTHSVWARAMSFTFIGLMVLLAIMFGLALAAMAAGWLPLSIHDSALPLSGMEGMAVGSVILLFVFGLLALVALLVVAIIYGLGVLAAGLLVFIPLMILISIFPALSPFVLFGLIIYWWFFKRKKKVTPALK